LIEGGYSGIAGPDTAWVGNDAIVGTNVPKARISNAGWGAIYVNSPGDSWTYLNRYGNIFAFGMQAVGNYPISAVFKPEEAWNFDIKLDDGKPASGRIWAFEASAGFGTASACTTSSSSTDYSGSYKLTTSALACSMWFKEAF